MGSQGIVYVWINTKPISEPLARLMKQHTEPIDYQKPLVKKDSRFTRNSVKTMSCVGKNQHEAGQTEMPSRTHIDLPWIQQMTPQFLAKAS